MPALAIDVLAPVFLNGVIASQEDRAGGQQVVEGPAGQESGQPPARPAPLREDAPVAGRVAGGERPHGPEEVGDGVPADGQQGSGQQEGAAEGGGLGEGPTEGIDQGADRVGQLRPQLPELSAYGPGRAGLPPPALPPLGLGPPRPPALGYTGHSSLLGRDTGSVLSP